MKTRHIGWIIICALVAGIGLSLSSTAFALQLLGERNQLATPMGQTAFGILLFQDLAVIPLLAILPLLGANGGRVDTSWVPLVKAVGLVLLVIVVGRTLLRTAFRLVASARSQEVFTASALLVALGTAVLTSAVGLSPALGAFLAGVLLADSEYRHELEADIEPFRGLLMGLITPKRLKENEDAMWALADQVLDDFLPGEVGLREDHQVAFAETQARAVREQVGDRHLAAAQQLEQAPPVGLAQHDEEVEGRLCLRSAHHTTC